MPNSYHKWVQRQGYLHGDEDCRKQAAEARRELRQIEDIAVDMADFEERVAGAEAVQGALGCHAEGCSAGRGIHDDIAESRAVTNAHVEKAVRKQRGEIARRYVRTGPTARRLEIFLADRDKLHYDQLHSGREGWNRGYGVRQLAGCGPRRM